MFRNLVNKTINKGYNAQNCEICKKNLSIFHLTRIHKCKRCERFVCSNCGSQKALISGYQNKPEVPHRICDVCNRELDVQDKIIRRNDLGWNQNSHLSERWRNAINLSQLEKQKSMLNTFSYFDYLEQYNKNKESYDQDIEMIVKDINLGRSDASVFNYSSRQFIEKIQIGSTVAQCRATIKNVLIALVVRYPYLGYCQGMNYLAVVLLCFTNEEIAFSLYCHIIENILPDKYYQKNGKGSGLIGFMAECYLLRNLIPSHFKESEVIPIQKFLEVQCPNYLLTLLINTLNITCVYFVWDLMFSENSLVPLERCIISLIKINLKAILQSDTTKTLLGDTILRETQYDDLKVQMNFQISPEKRSDFMDSFYQEFSEKWTKNNSKIHFQLKKITEFSVEEIKQIQFEFNLLIDQKYMDSSSSSNSDSPDLMTVSRFVKKGISKPEFLRLMDKVNQSIQSEEKITMQKDQLSKIFDLFIEVEGGVLDLREFLCCMSIVTRGDVKQKLEMFFYIFDSNQKQFLSKNEFFFLIDTLMKSLQIIDKNKELKEASCNFLNSLQEEYLNKEMISLSDFLLLLQHPFIQNISFVQQSSKRRNTCQVMASHLKDLYQQ